MSHYCHKCSAIQSLSTPGKAGFRETCLSCGTELHCCLHCVHYDPKAYNECRESQAERVLDKVRANYCEYFSFKIGKSSSKLQSSRPDPKKKLDDLFK